MTQIKLKNYKQFWNNIGNLSVEFKNYYIILRIKKFVLVHRLKFNVSSFLPTAECKEIETSYKDLMDNISKLINIIISKIGIIFHVFILFDHILYIYY